MRDNKLLRIRMNSDSSQENITDQVVASVSALNGNNSWEEVKVEEEVKRLLGFSETTQTPEIEIFGDFVPVLQSLANQAELLRKGNEILGQEKQTLEAEKNKVEKEKTDLKNQLADAEKKNKELEAKKEQSKAPMYTATVGVGLAAGLLLAAVLGHTTKLLMLAIVGVAAASVLVAGGITYSVLKPSTKPKQATANGCSKAQ